VSVSPGGIDITGIGIVPLTERVVDRMYDPLARMPRMFKS